MPPHASSPSRLSHSDYGSASFSSEDDCDATPTSTSTTTTTFIASSPGVCPHCKRVFEQPVALQCGHSLCSQCCTSLLAAIESDASTSAPPPIRRRPRMGISSYVTKSRPWPSTTTIVYRTPHCISCGAPPNAAAPIPNRELENFLRSMQTLRLKDFGDDANHKRDTAQRPAPTNESNIHDCKIAILGAKKVGKRSMMLRQYGNKMLFADLQKGDSGDVYSIDILANVDLEEALDVAHGFIVMYSTRDRQSFYETSELLKSLEQKSEHNQPFVLVGSKKDGEDKRRVTAFEGQRLARDFGCPFLEISSKENECIEEAFTELMILIQRQQRAWQAAIGNSIP